MFSSRILLEVAFGATCAVVVLACAEPKCPEGQQKVGTRCVRLRTIDGGSSTPDGPPNGERDDVESDRGDESPTPSDGNAGSSSKRDGRADVDVDPTPIAPSSCDEAPACAAGLMAACTTVCGSTGTGICTPSCGPAEAMECAVPAESCNGIDDDCNGVADEAMTRVDAKSERVWKATTATASGGMVAFVSRPSGGAWVCFGGAGPEFDQLTSDGSPTGKHVALGSASAFQYLTPDAAGNWLAILGWKRGTEVNSGTLQVQLYRADTLQLTAEQTVFTASTDACRTVVPKSVSVAEDEAGNVHVIYSRIELGRTLADGTCERGNAKSLVELVTYAPNKSWSMPKMLLTTAGSTAISRAKCQDEWLVVSTDGSLWQFALEGVVKQRYEHGLGSTEKLNFVREITPTCDGTVRLFASPFSRESPRRTWLRVWEIDGSGTFGVPRDVVVVDGAHLTSATLEKQGRLFLSTLNGSTHHLFEFDAAKRISTELAIPPSPLNPKALLLPSELGYPSALVDTGDNVLVAMARGLLSSAPDSDLGVTYRLGCP